MQLKNLFLFLFAVSIMASCSSPDPLATDEGKLAYANVVGVGDFLKKQDKLGLMDVEAVVSAMSSQLAGTDAGMTKEAAGEMFNKYISGTGATSTTAEDISNFSTSFGISWAENLKQQSLGSIDMAGMKMGLMDLVAGNMKMTPEAAQDVMKSHYENNKEAIDAERKKAQEAATAEASKMAGANKAKGAAFLAENATKEGVKTLDSGMQYMVMKEGSGAKPGPTSRVSTHYHGTLMDGSVFDSSVDRGTPASFGVNQVIPGWTEALQLMPVGSKWKLFIPSDLAYGDRGSGGKIGPGETLIFEVELLEIVE